MTFSTCLTFDLSNQGFIEPLNVVRKWGCVKKVFQGPLHIGLGGSDRVGLDRLGRVGWIRSGWTDRFGMDVSGRVGRMWSGWTNRVGLDRSVFVEINNSSTKLELELLLSLAKLWNFALRL